MAIPLLDIRGTWEEIEPQLEAIRGRRVRVIVLSDDAASSAAIPGPGKLDATLDAIWKSVPESSWSRFAPDFGENIDHYLYGTPKRA